MSDQATRILEAGPLSPEEQSRSISEEGEFADSSENLDPARGDQQADDDSPWEISSHSSSDTQSMTENDRSEAVSIPGVMIASISFSKVALTVVPPTTDLKPFSHLAQLYHSINFTITCLYKLPIRYPIPLDRLRQKDYIDTSLYQHLDVMYVRAKYPKLDAVVSSHLGKMMTRRRQLLRLRESHGQRLGSDEPQPKATTSLTSVHETLKTETTELKFAQTPSEKQLYGPSLLESDQSVASSCDEGKIDIEVPPRPKGENGDELDYFECPYCKVARSIKTQNQWR